MTDAGRDAERARRTVLQSLGAGLSAAALVVGARLTTAGDTEDHRKNAKSRASHKKALYVHGPTTRYQQIEDSPPGVFGDLENTSNRTVWMARLDVEFYAEDGRHLGTQAQHFLRIRPGESREIELQFGGEYFDDRSVGLTNGVLDTFSTTAESSPNDRTRETSDDEQTAS